MKQSKKVKADLSEADDTMPCLYLLASTGSVALIESERDVVKALATNV
jgi:hypothetical protein